MALTIEQRKKRLEAVAQHIRPMFPEMNWKVFLLEAKEKYALILRGVIGLFGREPEALDSHCIDLFYNGDVVVCHDHPELVGHINMRGKPETLAKKFHQELTDVFGKELLTTVFDEDENLCNCPKCRGDKAEVGWLLETLPERPLWVDLSAGDVIH